MARLSCCWISVTLCVLYVTIIFARRSVKLGFREVEMRSAMLIIGRRNILRVGNYLFFFIWNVHEEFIFLAYFRVFCGSFLLIINIWYRQITAVRSAIVFHILKKISYADRSELKGLRWGKITTTRTTTKTKWNGKLYFLNNLWFDIIMIKVVYVAFNVCVCAALVLVLVLLLALAYICLYSDNGSHIRQFALFQFYLCLCVYDIFIRNWTYHNRKNK